MRINRTLAFVVLVAALGSAGTANAQRCTRQGNLLKNDGGNVRHKNPPATLTEKLPCRFPQRPGLVSAALSFGAAESDVVPPNIFLMQFFRQSFEFAEEGNN